MKNHLFSYLITFLATGIYISDRLNMSTNLRIYLLAFFFGLFFSYLIKNKTLKICITAIQILVIGILIYNPNQYNSEEIKEHKGIYSLEILEEYKPSDKYLKYKVKNYVNGRYSLLHIPKLDTINIYASDTIILFGNSFGLNSAKNPFQFDYSEFLKKKDIGELIYSKQVLRVKSAGFNWKKWTSYSKNNLRNKMKLSGYSTESRAIISSMLLGDRSEISNELNDSYVLTGVVHILSISGLHVVMIYVVIQFLLKPINRLKKGKQLSIIISLIIIWIFSFYVDLQPPVFRSALMITIYYVSELLKRPKNIYHTISLSAFIILIFKPNYLFDLGFQLSFSAVFFIVWLHPIYSRIYAPKNTYIKYFYDLTGTSISAQLGTLPFATYYFNQFSGLFLFGNLFLIPASFIMIIGAIIAIVLSIFDLNINLYIKLFNWFINICNNYIKWLSTFDELILKQVYINVFTAVLLLIIILSIKPLILKRSKLNLFIIIGCFTIISFSRFIDVNRIRKANEVIVFHQFKSSLIGIRNGQHLVVIHSENLDSTTTKNYTIRPFEIHNRILKTTYIPIDSAFQNNLIYKSKNVLIVANQRFFIGEDLMDIPSEIDYILVRNSSFKFKDQDKLLEIKRVIADGSNYPSYVNELDQLLNKKSDSILWKTSERGYYQIKF